MTSLPPLLDAADLLRGIIRRNPSDRLSLAQIANHPWFEKEAPKLGEPSLTIHSTVQAKVGVIVTGYEGWLGQGLAGSRAGWVKGWLGQGLAGYEGLLGQGLAGYEGWRGTRAG